MYDSTLFSGLILSKKGRFQWARFPDAEQLILRAPITSTVEDKAFNNLYYDVKKELKALGYKGKFQRKNLKVYRHPHPEMK